MNKILKYIKALNFLVLLLVVNENGVSQTPETETALIKLGRIWSGVAANGDNATFDFRSGFFPNDFDVMHYRGQYNENWTGSGFKMACTNWKSPNDSIYKNAVFGPKNDFYPNGKVIVPIKSYLKYKYAKQTINGKDPGLTDFAVIDPTKFTEGTFDQLVEVTSRNVLGVDVKRKIMGWSQSFNDNYLIIDVELTNVGVTHKSFSGQDSVVQDTLKDFYFNMQMGNNNNYYSYGTNPSVPQGSAPNYSHLWQHYYGARPGDSLRVFYMYSADDPTAYGDNMGAPVTTQNGRLVFSDYTFYTVLHASKTPYVNIAEDKDDFLQPKVTYIGTETKIPDPGTGEDPYGNKNYWAIAGGYADKEPMSGIVPGTHHGINNDETGNPDFSKFLAGTVQSAISKNWSSFGPYNLPPNYKIRIVYAVGIAGIGIKKAQEIGSKWLSGTLENPPNMPDPNTGWLPSNFIFPNGATEMDKRKDRWLSMGKDSVMLTAWRAKWNFDKKYNIPQAPAPPENITITGYGEGVEIRWKATEAEKASNFAGYVIMRRVSNMDTVFYEPVYNSGDTDKAAEHIFMDKSVLFGSQVYYYILSKALINVNDLNADPSTRGKIIYSSRNLVPNVSYINPPRFSTDDMSKIRIAPNPYNLNDPLLRTYGFTDQRGIIFFNLPSVVTVKIYSENGDLLRTIDWNSPERAGSFAWDMLTSSQQVINSGVFIAVFQKPSGETSYQKFVVVR